MLSNRPTFCSISLIVFTMKNHVTISTPTPCRQTVTLLKGAAVALMHKRTQSTQTPLVHVRDI